MVLGIEDSSEKDKVPILKKILPGEELGDETDNNCQVPHWYQAE
jgi:hypothetical protein